MRTDDDIDFALFEFLKYLLEFLRVSCPGEILHLDRKVLEAR